MHVLDVGFSRLRGQSMAPQLLDVQRTASLLKQAHVLEMRQNKDKGVPLPPRVRCQAQT